MNPLKWEFLNEPLWQWFIFIIAVSLFITAWNGVLAEL